MLPKSINIHAILNLITETISKGRQQPNAITRIFSKDKAMNSQEQQYLLNLARQLRKVELHVKQNMTVNEHEVIDQNTIVKKQKQQLCQAFDDVLMQFAQIKKDIEHRLNLDNSKLMQQCLLELNIQMTELLKLIETEKHRLANYTKYGENTSLYQLCREMGAVYIPIKQGFDPFIGGYQTLNYTFKGKLVSKWTEHEISQLRQDERKRFDELKLKQEKQIYHTKPSNGQCAGMVYAWVNDCTSDEPIHYPYYANNWSYYYQNAQKILDNEFSELTVKYNQDVDINSIGSRAANLLIPNKVYHIAIQDKKNAHAIGFRIRSDGVYEIFDPNFFHVFCPSKESFQQVLNFLMSEYVQMFGMSMGAIYEYKNEQSNGLTTHFPNKFSILNATASQKDGLNDKKLVEIIIDKHIKLSSAYIKNGKQDKLLYIDAMSKIIYGLIPLVNEPSLVRLVLDTFKKAPTKGNLIESREDIKELLIYLEGRIEVVNQKEFKEEVKERKKVARAYAALHEKFRQKIAENYSDLTKQLDLNLDIDESSRMQNSQKDRVVLADLFRQFDRLQKTETPLTVIFKPIEVGFGRVTQVASKAAGKVKSLFIKNDKTHEDKSSEEPDEAHELLKLAQFLDDTHSLNISRNKQQLNRRARLGNQVGVVIQALKAMALDVEQNKSDDFNFAILLIQVEDSPSLSQLGLLKLKYLEKLRAMIHELEQLDGELLTEYQGEVPAEKEKIDLYEMRFLNRCKLSLRDADEIEKNGLKSLNATKQLLNKSVQSMFSDKEIEGVLTLISEDETEIHDIKRTLNKSLVTIIHAIEELRNENYHKSKDVSKRTLAEIWLARKYESRAKKLNGFMQLCIRLNNKLVKCKDDKLIDIVDDITFQLNDVLIEGAHVSVDYQYKLKNKFELELDPKLSQDEMAVVKYCTELQDWYRKIIDIIEFKKCRYHIVDLDAITEPDEKEVQKAINEMYALHIEYLDEHIRSINKEIDHLNMLDEVHTMDELQQFALHYSQSAEYSLAMKLSEQSNLDFDDVFFKTDEFNKYFFSHRSECVYKFQLLCVAYDWSCDMAQQDIFKFELENSLLGSKLIDLINNRIVELLGKYFNKNPTSLFPYQPIKVPFYDKEGLMEAYKLFKSLYANDISIFKSRTLFILHVIESVILLLDIEKEFDAKIFINNVSELRCRLIALLAEPLEKLIIDKDLKTVLKDNQSTLNQILSKYEVTDKSSVQEAMKLAILIADVSPRILSYFQLSNELVNAFAYLNERNKFSQYGSVSQGGLFAAPSIVRNSYAQARPKDQLMKFI